MSSMLAKLLWWYCTGCPHLHAAMHTNIDMQTAQQHVPCYCLACTKLQMCLWVQIGSPTSVLAMMFAAIRCLGNLATLVPYVGCYTESDNLE